MTIQHNTSHRAERVDLAAMFHWTARMNVVEAMSNHISVAICDDASGFPMAYQEPDRRHLPKLMALPNRDGSDDAA